MSYFVDSAVKSYGDFTRTINHSADLIVRDTPKLLLALFSLIGFIGLAGKIYSYFRMLLSVYVTPGNKLRNYGKKGSWVLVTGASEGIGKEYALQIAKQGFNLLLVARTQSKLDILALEIEATKNEFIQPKVKTLAIDFALNKDEDYEKLGKLITDLDICILVNNVGLSHSIPVPFAITSQDEIKDIIGINCLATLKVTQLVLPGMIQRKKGLVLTMGSFAGLTPTPLLATYSGSKAFLQHWSTALASELDGSGIDIQFTVAYLITSAMSKIRRPTWTIPTPKAFVKAALGQIGRRGGSTHYAYSNTPYPSHAIMQWWIENTLGLGSQTVISYNRGFHQSIRHRALRKGEREASKAKWEAAKLAEAARHVKA